jgi:hypothetical protein
MVLINPPPSLDPLEIFGAFFLGVSVTILNNYLMFNFRKSLSDKAIQDGEYICVYANEKIITTRTARGYLAFFKRGLNANTLVQLLQFFLLRMKTLIL